MAPGAFARSAGSLNDDSRRGSRRRRESIAACSAPPPPPPAPPGDRVVGGPGGRGGATGVGGAEGSGSTRPVSQTHRQRTPTPSTATATGTGHAWTAHVAGDRETGEDPPPETSSAEQSQIVWSDVEQGSPSVTQVLGSRRRDGRGSGADARGEIVRLRRRRVGGGWVALQSTLAACAERKLRGYETPRRSARSL